MTLYKLTWWVRLLVYLSFWTAAYFVLMSLFATSAAGWQLIDHIYTSIFMSTLLIPVTINDWFLYPRFLKRRRYAGYFVLLAINIVVGVFINQLLFDRLIDYIMPGYYFISYHEFTDLLQYFAVFVLVSLLISMALDWFNLQEQRYQQGQLEKEQTSAEFKALVSQVNPHFLFNSLTILYALATKNSKETAGAVLKLSEILRYVIYQNNDPSVTLRSEIKILRDFIELQRYRIHPSTEIELTESISNDDAMVAPMLFLPLLENSFKHGIHNETRDAFVRAKIVEQDGLINFTIINNKAGSIEKQPGGFGLANLGKRLQLMYPGQHSLHISETATTFTAAVQLNTV